MKKFLKYLVVVLIITAPVLSMAAEFRSGEQPSIKKDEKIASDVYMAGGTVTSAGVVNGDLVTAGGNVVISGNVASDLIVGGGNVNVLSNIGDSIRAAGGTVIITGAVKKDVIVGGGNISISGPGVGGDVVVGGGNVRIDAPVAGNLYVGGGNVYINAPIAGNVKIEAKKVTLGSGAIISGNLTYKSTQELTKENGAIVKGIVDFKLLENKDMAYKKVEAIFSAFLIWKFFTLLFCALIVGLSLRKFSKKIIAFATERPWFEMGRGLLVMIILPIISIILFITLVGIPFGILGMLGFIILMLFTWIMTPIVLGSVVYKYFSKKEIEVSWKTIILGVLVYSVLGIIPILGGLAQLLIMLITIGSIIAFKLQVIKEWR